MRSPIRAAMVLAMAGVLASGQETRSTIRGQVTDQQGAAVPGVRVTVTRTETDTVVTATTNAAGHFEVPLLLPGQYTVSVESAGFKEAVRSGIELRSGSTVDADVTLEIGPLSESVSVTAGAPLIDTSTPASERFALALLRLMTGAASWR